MTHADRSRGDGLTGVVLVGGSSHRFGSPKALARLGAETLAGRAWRLLGEVCDERFAVGKRTDGLALPYPLVDDGTDVRAPIAGVVAGLRAAAGELAIVVPVDCPLLEPDDLRALAAACADAAVPPTGPLPGAYRRTALPVLERRLEAGLLVLRDALTELDTRVVALDPGRLANVNTPAELASLGDRRASAVPAPAAAPDGSSRLSSRQREILRLLADGIRVREIAVRLGLSEATVRNHIRELLRRLDCHSQLQAVARARERHLL